MKGIQYKMAFVVEMSFSLYDLINARISVEFPKFILMLYFKFSDASSQMIQICVYSQFFHLYQNIFLNYSSKMHMSVKESPRIVGQRFGLCTAPGQFRSNQYHLCANDTPEAVDDLAAVDPAEVVDTPAEFETAGSGAIDTPLAMVTPCDSHQFYHR